MAKQFGFWTFCLLVATSCAVQPKHSNPRISREPNVVSAFNKYVNESPEHNYSCKEIFDILNEKPKPTTILAALTRLKERRPKYFSHYGLLPRSNSLHGSSFSHPRVMLVGGTGKAVITFNGSSDQIGYESIETMCFNETLAS